MEAVTPAERRHEDLDLSLSQREVWLDQRTWSGSAHLNIGGCSFLQGPLDIPRFKQSLAMLVAESDALRLAPLVDGQQRLLAHGDVNLEVLDMGAEPHPKEAMRAW